jgi:NAD(P)-dependent dehydrogenase (short-subunit alcohol dehydrogenase family)
MVPDRLPRLRLADLTGRRAVVTGASSGIGFATALGLAAAGSTVVLAVRDQSRGASAAARIQALCPGANVSVELVELGSLVSVAAFARRVGEAPVHLLVNNAGINAGPDERSADGFDLTVAVNYLGAWALTAGLWPALLAGAARVVNLGSLVAVRGRIGTGFGTPTGSTSRSYADSKLAQIVFAGELRHRSTAAAAGVHAVAAHPGWSQTRIVDPPPPAAGERAGELIGALQSASDGAQPVLLAATDPRPSAYYGPSRRWGAAGPAGPAKLPPGALVPGVGPRLWEMSTELTGVPFEP